MEQYMVKTTPTGCRNDDEGVTMFISSDAVPIETL